MGRVQEQIIQLNRQSFNPKNIQIPLILKLPKLALKTLFHMQTGWKKLAKR